MLSISDIFVNFAVGLTQVIPLHFGNEALCLSYGRKPEKLSTEQRKHSGSHAYSVGFYCYICSQAFSGPPIRT